MGWKENGKYGVSTGRTVRSPFADGHGFYSGATRNQAEVLLKFTRGTNNLSSSEMDEFLAENDICDGLGDFAESSTRQLRGIRTGNSNVHLSSVPYSLKKRKRWILSDLEKNGVELNYSADRPNVTFVHRRLQNKYDAADCIAIQKTKQNEVFTPRKRKYTRVQDLLKKCDETVLEPEVGYEMLYRYPSSEYPECGEVRGSRYRRSFLWSLRNPRKSRSKNKGVKNMGYRWGLYSDGELRSGKITQEESHETFLTYKVTESKVKGLDERQLFSDWKASEESSCSRGTINLGCYIEELSKHPMPKKRQHRRSFKCSIQDQSLKNGFKYGKKSAIYIDQEPSPSMFMSADAAKAAASASKPLIFQPEKKVVVTLPLDAHDVKPGNLKAEWNDLYTEGNSLPRKFTIDLMPLLSTESSITNESCCVLFETAKKTSNDLSYATTDVSLHVAETKDQCSNFSNVATKFYSEIESVKQDIWKVHDVISYAVLCLQDCCQPVQYPTFSSNCPKDDKPWRPVEVLGSMFGWKSEICTQMEIKSELRMKIKKQQGSHCMNEIHICNETDDLKTIEFCGICYEELGNQTFTAMKQCHHVFCNECWEVHLKTQISLGNTDLRCPGYKCDVHVDDVTSLALVPSWHGKLLSRKIDKALEASPELRWCPSRKCDRVFRTTVSGALAKANNPISVGCACGGLWCFHCGRQAHWPATCSGDEKFQKVTKHILVEMELKKEDLVTSVLVRNCPTCRYPIEKHLGCNFMYCTMCQTSFCWECLMPMSKHKDGCQRHEQSKEVELNLSLSSRTSHFAKYFSVYCNNKKARTHQAMSHQIQRLRTVDKRLACYKSMCTSCSHFDGVMEKIMQSGYPEILRNATEFKYYAHLTLEGAAKMAIVSKSTCRGLNQHIQQLQFIAEKIDELAKCDIAQLSRQNHLSKLSDFLYHGKNCIFTIGQFLANRERNRKP